MMNVRRATGAAAALIAGGVLLAGCGSEPDQPTDTTTTSSSSSSAPPTSSSTTTPTDPLGENAIKVVKNFEKTMNDLQLDPSKETGALGAYATGQAYDQRTYSLRQSREAGERQTGRVKIIEASASKQSATRQRVTVCTDLTDRTITARDGKKVDLPYERLGRVYTVDKSDGAGQDGKWRVTAEEATTAC